MFKDKIDRRRQCESGLPWPLDLDFPLFERGKVEDGCNLTGFGLGANPPINDRPLSSRWKALSHARA